MRWFELFTYALQIKPQNLKTMEQSVIYTKPESVSTARSGGVSRESQLGNSTIVQAVAKKFVEPTPVKHENVQGLLFCWCASGTGKVITNSQEYEFSRGNFLFLPWEHSITFVPDELRPFYLKSLHVVPSHDPKVELTQGVGNSETKELLDLPIRKNVDHPMLRTAALFDDVDDANLALLFNYALGVFSRETPPLPVARQMARLFLYEFFSLKMSIPTEEEDKVPRRLQYLIDFIKDNISEDISLTDIAAYSELSQATINRLFREHLETSTMNFIHQKKIERAKHLLLVTDLAVSDIGPHIGINDVYYFSRFFKKMTGYSPTEF